MSKQRGFTLIEVMIVVVIIGILASIAYPSYREYVLKGNRAEGKAKVLQVLQAQERHYSQNMTYTTNLADLGLTAGSETGKYNVALAACGGGATLARCVQATGTAVSPDPKCLTLTATTTGARTPVDCWK